MILGWQLLNESIRFGRFYTMENPTLPKGTRDFGPATMAKRQFILENIKRVFQKYGFQPLETPAMENLTTLTGKYGEEGDQLLFKVLDSGDPLKNFLNFSNDDQQFAITFFRNLTSQIVHKYGWKHHKNLEHLIQLIKDTLDETIKISTLDSRLAQLLTEYVNYETPSLAFDLSSYLYQSDVGGSIKKDLIEDQELGIIIKTIIDRIINFYAFQKVEELNGKKMSRQFSEKGLRYDLTVPLARYVVMNRHEITFPFKRYQIQPVWRADRPQKGRYRS